MSVRRRSRFAVPMLLVASLSPPACDPQKSDWGFDAIRTMVTPADDPALGCGLRIPAIRPRACIRLRSSRGRARQPLWASTRACARKIPIRHIVVMMKENRSFDHLLGRLHDLGRPDVEGVPATPTRIPICRATRFPSHATTTCIPARPRVTSSASVLDQASTTGPMDGFVINAAQTTWHRRSLRHVADTIETDFPFYY